MAFTDLESIQEEFAQYSRREYSIEDALSRFGAWIRAYKARWMRERFLFDREPAAVVRKRPKRSAHTGKPIKYCGHPGCEQKHRTSGLCAYHYNARRRRGY